MGCAFSRNRVRFSRIIKRKKVSGIVMQDEFINVPRESNRACFALIKSWVTFFF